MDVCRAQRQSLTEEFKELQSFFVVDCIMKLDT